MIHINRIRISEFRGIKELDLNLGGKNFGICGPNGTGKSGVVDAIEFCLTGNVTRLSGQGQGELSVKRHAPHVDQSNSPDKAKVEITATVRSLGKDVKIARSVKDPKNVKIAPAEAQINAIVGSLQSHPEFALSRREIAKYIITPPGRRSDDVQNLLRLDYVRDLRKSFMTNAKKCTNDAKEAERKKQTAENDFKKVLDLNSLDSETILEKVNEKRNILGLSSLSELPPKTSFKKGIAEKGNGSNKIHITREIALSDLADLAKTIDAGEPEVVKQHQESVLKNLKKLQEDRAALSLARMHGFIATGIELIAEDACPLCDKQWDADELRKHLEAKLLSAEEIGALLESLRSAFGEIKNSIEVRIADISKASGYAAKLELAVPRDNLYAYVNALEDIKTTLESFQDDFSQIEKATCSIQKKWWEMPEDARAGLNETQMAVNAMPGSSDKDQAIGILAVLQDRYEKLLWMSEEAKTTVERSKTAQKVYEHYNSVSNKILENIYESVAEEFTEFYKAINEDEGKFVGELKAQPAKLSFNVDFYGRGTFPPGAYHSEGHQDGMGLCLYLALMKRTLGNDFTIAVLDDVLMSVDAGHRREVCRLLKTSFPGTQFILTTHDRVWYQYMKTEGLIESGQHFKGWNVETGPRIWDDSEIWMEVEDALSKDEVPRAAALLRRYLEYIATVLADNLRARVEYRTDANYDLGDLLPPVLSQWCNRLNKGIKSARSWGHDETKAQLDEMLQEAKKLISNANAENWSINKAVHFNAWENFTKTEFKKVADAYKSLLNHFRCPNPKCGGYPYLIPRKGSPEQLRCSCGKININMKNK